MKDHVKKQLEEIRFKISEAEKKSGRLPGSVKLLAVSKTFPPEAVMAAYEAGQRMFGENRVQELESKAPALPRDIEWHLIGHLQSNKAVKAVKLASHIHSVDSLKLLQRIESLAAESGRLPSILLEMNVSGEESKFGISGEDEALRIAEQSLKCSHVRLAGLMTMAPLGADETELRKVFSGLRTLRDRIESSLGTKLPELSMGMSQDYETAIAEGSTIVRIGTAIFGGRSAQ